MSIPDWLERQMKRTEDDYRNWPSERREEYDVVYGKEEAVTEIMSEPNKAVS